MLLEPRLPKLNHLEKSYIEKIEARPVVQDKIVFYGDSSFTRWVNNSRWDNPVLEDEIRMHDGSQACVNRGFGTSTSEELLYYYPRVIRPLRPRALVVICHGNDRAAGYTPAEILFLQTRILEWARTDFPGIQLFLCNTRPLLKHVDATKSTLNQITEYDELVKHYCDTHPDTTLCDHLSFPGFFEEGKTGDRTAVIPEQFVEDKVHYNRLGYGVYKEFFTKIFDEKGLL